MPRCWRRLEELFSSRTLARDAHDHAANGVMADMRLQVEDSWMTFHDAGDSVASSFPPWTRGAGRRQPHAVGRHDGAAARKTTASALCFT